MRIVVGNVTPAETYSEDNVKTFRMHVVAVTRPPPTGGEFPWATALLVLGLAAAGVAAVLVAAWLLLTPREPRSLEPPPAEPAVPVGEPVPPPLLLVTFTGPYTITYLRAEDAPQRPVFPYGY